MSQRRKLEKSRTFVKTNTRCPSVTRNDTRQHSAAVSMENLIASVDSMITAHPALENTCTRQHHSTVARQQSWTYRGLTQIRSQSQNNASESLHRGPSAMASPKTIDTPPPSPLSRVRRPSASSIPHVASSSSSASIDLQRARGDTDADPVCVQCGGQGTLTREQYDVHVQREAKYREIAQTNHELRRTLDLSNKRMSILLAQFRQGQEDSENTHQQLELLQAELEEARVYQLDLMEQNHALRAAAAPAADHHHFFSNSPVLPPNTPDSPIDRQLSLMESQETSHPYHEILERRIEGLLNTIDEQDALIENLASQLADNDNQEPYEIDGSPEEHPFPERRGAVSIEPNSYLGRQISQSVQHSPLSSPQLTRSQPHNTHSPAATELCPSVSDALAEAEAEADSDLDSDEDSDQASTHPYVHPETPLHIIYSLPSTPLDSSAALDHPAHSTSASHAASLKRAKRLPHPAEVWSSLDPVQV